MKKLLTLILVGLIFTALSGCVGENDMTTHITTLDQLQAMKDNLAEDYILDNDIDASPTSGWNGGLGFEPVGTAANKFTGSFDGQGHIITGLFINRPAIEYVGLFGYADGVTIRNVTLPQSDITGKGVVGPLAGRADNSVVMNCHATGTVTAQYEVGGLIGTVWNSTLSDCDAATQVNAHTKTFKVGGLIGETVGVTISDSFATGDVVCTAGTSECYIGGLIGLCDSTTFSNCYAEGNVSGFDWTGGLCGTYRDNSEITYCHARGDVSGRDYVGGLVGQSHRSNITDSFALGNVTATQDYVGGLIGSSFESIVSRSCAAGNVIGRDYVGGLIGINTEAGIPTKEGQAAECYAIGDVQGNEYVGGLIGINAADISDCFSQSKVNGADWIGGLCGFNGDPVSNSYSTGAVTGTGANVGGLMAGNAGVVTNSFWDIETSGQATSAAGTGKTTEEMKTKDTFTDAGWDFATIWNICEPPNYVPDYPFLRGNSKCKETECTEAEQQVFIGYIG